MLIESAFSILPESVAGLGFQKVNREANAVGCFSFSLLNALHAKNILDPIRYIQMEKNYGSKSTPLPTASSNRHCDLFLDYGGSKIGSKILANYGWRYRNYVEAKYLKSYKQTQTGQDTRVSVNSAEIIADLVRLIALVPEPDIYQGKSNPKTSSARYFLSLSDKKPDSFVNKHLKSLHSIFESPQLCQNIEIDLTTKKSNKLSARVGAGFNNLTVKIPKTTTFYHYPLDVSLPDMVWMLLIRIDEAKIELLDNGNLRSFEILRNRSLIEGAAGDYKYIRDFVSANIN